MSQGARFAVFLAIVLGVWTAFHAYAFSRAFSVPRLAAAVPRGGRVALLLLLWLSYPLGRVLVRNVPGLLASSVEMLGAVWMGFLFLLATSFLAADLVTGFGRLWPAATVPARTAALALGLGLSAFALVQGLRGPRVVSREVAVAGLGAEHDGLRVVQLSDLHLGSLLGERWLARRVEQVKSLAPDLVVVTGDLVDSEVDRVEPLVPLVSRLSAPLGVWGVSGNHEFYAGIERSMALYERAGIRVLRDGWAEAAPGLVVAGVDDLSARAQLGLDGDPLARAFTGLPHGTATIFLSHSPLRAPQAARLGASLMLCGHTHAGQIWPFTYLSAIPYPMQAGRHDVDGLPVLVSRGTGTWGPPMRLFKRSEIVEITLRRG